MSDKRPILDEVHNKWDYSWKMFLCTEYPWCRKFVQRLLPKEFADFDIDTADLTDINVEELSGGKRFIADKMLQYHVDEVNHIVHFEFQAKEDAGIAFRCLRYGLLKKHLVLSDEFSEEYILPDTSIVYVRRNKWSDQTTRVLRLLINRVPIEITYPVVRGYEVVPEIGAIMEAKDKVSLGRAIDNFLAVYGQGTTAEECNELMTACYLVAQEEAYGSGLSKEDIMAGANETRKHITTWREEIEEAEQKGRVEGRAEGRAEGREEGRQEALEKFDIWVRRMAKGLGKPYDELIRLAIPEASDVNGDTKQVKPLNFDNK